MRFSAHPKTSILVSFLAMLTIVSGFMLSGVFFRTTPIQAAGLQQDSATKGTLSQAVTGDSANPSDIYTTRPRGTLPFQPGNNGGAHAGSIQAPSSSLDQSSAAKLLSNFNGVGSLDSARTNFGAEFEPPDQGLCVGNGFVLEPVNSAYRIYRPDGSTVKGPINVNFLFNDGPKQFTSDPRCYYDKSTNTWFAIILFINSTGTRSRVDIAVNPSGDPTQHWTAYRLDTTDDGTNGTPKHPTCPCLGDQPLLGIDQYNLYISTNEFSLTGPGFNGAQIYALSKAELVALAQKIDFVHFANLNIGGAVAASVQPAITNGAANAEYFMNSIDPFGTFDNRLGVWAMTDQDAVMRGDIPKLSSVVITSEIYGVPPKAKQQGATSKLDAGDDRMQQVQYINGDLWGALDTGVTISHDTAQRAGAAWFRVQPQLNGEKIGGAAIKSQGYVALKGNYLLYPAIQASPQGTAAIVMTLSGSTFFPSAVYTTLQAGQTSFGPIHVAAYGTGPYDPTATRWGDYSWAILAPDNNSFWMATEYIPPKSSQTKDGRRNWGTRVLDVSA